MGYRYPEFDKFVNYLLLMPLIRLAVLVLIGLGIRMAGHSSFSWAFLGATTFYFMLDCVCFYLTLSKVRNAPEATLYVLWQSPEDLISNRKEVVYRLLQDNESE